MGLADEIRAKKYITVETYKRDGSPVRTPVWFCISDGEIVIVTRSGTGKAKRLKNDPRVRVAECTMRGRVLGAWVHGHARILGRSEAAGAVSARDKKYGIAARIASVITRGKGDFFVFAVRPDVQ